MNKTDKTLACMELAFFRMQKEGNSLLLKRSKQLRWEDICMLKEGPKSMLVFFVFSFLSKGAV